MEKTPRDSNAYNEIFDKYLNEDVIVRELNESDYDKGKL